MPIVSVTDFINHNTDTKTYTVQPGASVASIQSVISTAGAGSTVLFSAGTHNLSEKLTIDRSDIQIKGAGEGLTTIVGGMGLQSQIFFFVGAVDQSVNTHATAAITKGQNQITINDTTGFKVGDTLYVGQTNDEAFMLANYPTIVDYRAAAENPLRETFAEITAINGNTITLSLPIAYDMAAGTNTMVQRWETLKNVGLSDMTIRYATTGTPNPDLMANALPSMDNADAVVFNMAVGAQVKNLSIINPTSTGLEMRNVIATNVDGLTVQGTFNKDEGNGYGLHIAGSFNGVYQNLNITDMRHSVLFSSWNAEVNNYVQVDFTNRGINYHGSDDYNNIVYVDRAVYREPGNGISWALVGPGGQNHPATVISKNINQFGYAQGGFRDEILFGRNGGSELYGMGGNDTLVGGNGNDVIGGGIGNDTMTGRAGVDRFVRNFGDGVDTITDFRAGIGGDVLVLNGYNLSGVGSIVVRNVGADAEIVLLSSARLVDKVILKGLAGATFDARNFVVGPNVNQALDVTLSTDADVVQGGSANDLVRAFVSGIGAADIITLGTGTDTFRIERSTFSLDTATLEHTRGIDVLDTSQATANSVTITQGFMNTTDTGDLLINIGSRSIASLDISTLNAASQVFLRGSGTVNLREDVDNTLWLDSQMTGKVNGRGGDDMFNIGNMTRGSVTGGAGDDTFKIMGDFLSSALRLDGGIGNDLLHLQATVDYSLLDMRNVRGFETILFSGDNNKLALTDTLMNTLQNIDGGAADTDVTLDISGLTRSKTLTIGSNMDVVLQGTSTATQRYVLTDATSKFVGSTGVETIVSGVGANTVTGGAGKDTFAFTANNQFGDTITDFSTLLGFEDRLDLATLFDANGLGVETTASAFTKGILRLSQSGTDTVLAFDRDGAAGNAFASTTVAVLDDTLATSVTQNLINV